MCKAMNITVKVTVAESPFSNGLVERHNMIIANMLDKILDNQQRNLGIALLWCLIAKKPISVGLWSNSETLSTFNIKPLAFTPSDTKKS